jgi:hypothetical protein
MQAHEPDEIIQAILEQRFVPLRLVAGKLQPPPPTAELPVLVSVSREEALSQTPEERRAVMERLRAR